MVLFFFCTRAMAGCSLVKDLGTVSISLSSKINVSANAAVGSTIDVAVVQIPGTGAGVKFATCTGDDSMYWAIRDGPLVADRIGATSVSGVGYIAYLNNNIPIAPHMDSTWRASAGAGGLNATFTAALGATIKLVVTGPVSSGPVTLNPGGGSGIQNQVAAFYVNSSWSRLFKVVLAGSSAVVASACQVTTPSIAVALPAVSSSKLSKVGATAGAQTTSINLTCPTSSRVFITLTDSANPTNTSNTLTLKPDSTAQGVGLQILNAQGPVSYGPDSPTAGNKNQWLVGTPSGGVLKIPLTVQYIQTAATVRPGTVNGVATFTMSYQ